jgi:hypothetical protein
MGKLVLMIRLCNTSDLIMYLVTFKFFYPLFSPFISQKTEDLQQQQRWSLIFRSKIWLFFLSKIYKSWHTYKLYPLFFVPHSVIGSQNINLKSTQNLNQIRSAFLHKNSSSKSWHCSNFRKWSHQINNSSWDICGWFFAHSEPHETVIPLIPLYMHALTHS